MHLSLAHGQLVSLIFAAMLLFTCVSSVPMKPTSCCESTSPKPIETPITSCRIQTPSGQCVKAVIFVSEGKHYCSFPGARWVQTKVKEMFRNGTPCEFPKHK
ncbi:hypothetical protein MATL_G00023370 [Megalops atlanticus]|uniref:Chemokine interleukin-8-like domain-containing protein n=1 Tax=Megalops atlanticus TaxID=7932 RepID=A0A9D3TJF2_MEGAT|nr:hypothetical protein MATL_G00023370 [Megalops atlanticus]